MPGNIARGLSIDRIWDIVAMTEKNRKNIRNVLRTLNGLGLQKNSSISFLKAAVMKIKDILFSTLVTLR